MVEIVPKPKDEVKLVEERYAQIIKSTIDSFFNDNKKELNIIPKKSNIDLKRKLLPKWEKLDKKTEIAIIELLSIKNLYYFFITIFFKKKKLGETKMRKRIKIFQKTRFPSLGRWNSEGERKNSNQCLMQIWYMTRKFITSSMWKMKFKKKRKRKTFRQLEIIW